MKEALPLKFAGKGVKRCKWEWLPSIREKVNALQLNGSTRKRPKTYAQQILEMGEKRKAEEKAAMEDDDAEAPKVDEGKLTEICEDHASQDQETNGNQSEEELEVELSDDETETEKCNPCSSNTSPQRSQEGGCLTEYNQPSFGAVKQEQEQEQERQQQAQAEEELKSTEEQQQEPKGRGEDEIQNDEKLQEENAQQEEEGKEGESSDSGTKASKSDEEGKRKLEDKGQKNPSKKARSNGKGSSTKAKPVVEQRNTDRLKLQELTHSEVQSLLSFPPVASGLGPRKLRVVMNHP
eukprot:763820-Hanusia_phi.AAC.4